MNWKSQSSSRGNNGGSSGSNNGYSGGRNNGNYRRRRYNGNSNGNRNQRNFGNQWQPRTQQRWNQGRFDQVSQYSNSKYKGNVPMVLGNVSDAGSDTGSNRSSPRNRGSIICHNCGKPGHMKRDCWKPSGSGNGRGNNGNGGNVTFGMNQIANYGDSRGLMLPDGS